jgi:hypothetical protein
MRFRSRYWTWWDDVKSWGTRFTIDASRALGSSPTNASDSVEGSTNDSSEDINPSPHSFEAHLRWENLAFRLRLSGTTACNGLISLTARARPPSQAASVACTTTNQTSIPPKKRFLPSTAALYAALLPHNAHGSWLVVTH